MIGRVALMSVTRVHKMRVHLLQAFSITVVWVLSISWRVSQRWTTTILWAWHLIPLLTLLVRWCTSERWTSVVMVVCGVVVLSCWVGIGSAPGTTLGWTVSGLLYSLIHFIMTSSRPGLVSLFLFWPPLRVDLGLPVTIVNTHSAWVSCNTWVSTSPWCVHFECECSNPLRHWVSTSTTSIKSSLFRIRTNTCGSSLSHCLLEWHIFESIWLV